MKRPAPVSHPTKPRAGFVGAPMEPASAFIDARIKELGDTSARADQLPDQG
jgi:hypothetical protein